MASEKISQLPSGVPAQDGDLIPIDRSGTNYSLTASSIAALSVHTITAVFDGGGSALTGSLSVSVPVPYAGNIQNVTLIADVSGSVTVDVCTVALASYTGAGSTSSITASDKPALSSAIEYSDSTLAGWTTALAANTVVCFKLTNPTTVTRVTITLKVAA